MSRSSRSTAAGSVMLRARRGAGADTSVSPENTGERRSGVITPPGAAIATARCTSLRSWRTFPGQPNASNTSSVSALRRTSGLPAKRLSPEALAQLARYNWPGNVRQLRNAARQMVIASRASESVQIGPQIEKLLREAAPTSPSAPMPAEAWVSPEPPPARKRAEAQPYRSPADVTEQEILEALRACRWEMKPAAERLGISRPSLYLLSEKFPSIRKAVDLTRAEILEARERCNGDLDAMVDHLEVSKRGLQQRMAQLGIS